MARLSSLSKRWGASSRLSKTPQAANDIQNEQTVQRPDTNSRFNFEREATSPVLITRASEDLDNIVLNEQGRSEPEAIYESRWSTTTHSLDSFANNEPYPGVLDEYTESSSKRRSKRLSAAIRKGLPERQDLTELLCNAAVQGDVQMIGRIQSAGGDFTKKNSDGHQPIHMAAMAGQLEAVKALVLSGADIDAKDSAGRTALHHAAKLSNEYLHLRPSAVRRISSSSQQSALRFSYVFGQQENTQSRRPSYASTSSTGSEDKCSLVEALLRSGANMESRDREGNSPLHIAALVGDLLNVTTLLDHGANRHSRNKAGLTPLDALEADEEKYNEKISKLLK